MTNKKSVARRTKMRLQRRASRRSLPATQVAINEDGLPDMQTVTDNPEQPVSPSRGDPQPGPPPPDKKVRTILAI